MLAIMCTIANHLSFLCMYGYIARHKGTGRMGPRLLQRIKTLLKDTGKTFKAANKSCVCLVTHGLARMHKGRHRRQQNQAKQICRAQQEPRLQKRQLTLHKFEFGTFSLSFTAAPETPSVRQADLDGAPTQYTEVHRPHKSADSHGNSGCQVQGPPVEGCARDATLCTRGRKGPTHKLGHADQTLIRKVSDLRV